MKNFLEAIRHNTALKIFSLILAILLWAFVQLAQNPELSYDAYEVPISITGEADINSEGYVISAAPKNLKTNLTISTKRSYLNNFDPGSLSAYVDVSTAKAVGEYSFPVRVRSEDGNITVVSKSPSTVSLYVDRIISTQKPIKLSYDGSLHPDYYIDKNNIVISPEMATIKVPELVESKISEVVVHLDMTNVKSEIYNEFTGIAVDSRGEEVTDKFLKITNESITVQVPILKRKTVPVAIKNLPDNLTYNLNIEQIEIAGKESLIDSVTEIDGYINDYDPEHSNASYTVTLKLPDDIISTEEKTIKLYVVD
ncbi:MAG: hypothetical protein J6A61_07410 [Clostridia bacterium]|nr:hypothetical protein [Clostridia bacterium]